MVEQTEIKLNADNECVVAMLRKQHFEHKL
jgi:hypothetical protein